MAKKRQPVQRYSRLGAYTLDHLRTLTASLGRLSRSPLANLMTLTVIGIALALPSGLYVLLNNLQKVGAGWENAARISLFLTPGTEIATLHQIAKKLGTRNEILKVETISAKEALSDFREHSSFGSAIDALEENPLPHVIVLTPTPQNLDVVSMQGLINELQEWPEIDIAQSDMKWLNRLNAIIDLARRAAIVIAILLAFAVFFVVGNTIRLEIYNRREEIEVCKLIGATDAFVRRPFLYIGMWYGILGGALAWLIVNASLVLIEAPATRLISLYYSEFATQGLTGTDGIKLVAFSLALGIMGSWLAVSRHLGANEPD